MIISNNQQVFFKLIQSGLWGNEILLSPFKEIDYEIIFSLAEAQSIIGLVAVGLENVKDVKIPQNWALQFAGKTLQIEQQNKAMNLFIVNLIEKLRKNDIYTLLLKGQGVALCYERPLWRSSGDVDLFLSEDNYKKAKSVLVPMASNIEPENVGKKHLGMSIDNWVVELHSSLSAGLSAKIDDGLEEIKRRAFYEGRVRSIMIDGSQIFLLKAEDDAIYVFTHILEHFYKGGIGLRQICDWCRLLWTYRASIDVCLLEKRLKQMRLQAQWKGFGAFAVDYLGMPSEAMPLYSSDDKWSRKAKRICDFVLEVGNFGHNRDNSYYVRYPYIIRKIYSFGRRCGDLFRHARIFPLDSLRFFPYMMYNGVKAALNDVRNE